MFVCLSVGLDGVKTASFAARLLAVNAVARDLLPGYAGPLLSDAMREQLSCTVSIFCFLLAMYFGKYYGNIMILSRKWYRVET